MINNSTKDEYKICAENFEFIMLGLLWLSSEGRN